MPIRAAATALLIGAVLFGTIACSREVPVDDPAAGQGSLDTNPDGSTHGSDSFRSRMIGQLKTLKSVTLWRVGQCAKGPGRRPREPIAAVAVKNHTCWAFSIKGDGRFEGTNLAGVSPAGSPHSAQAAVVELIQTATGRDVGASWAKLDADTWIARASFTP